MARQSNAQTTAQQQEVAKAQVKARLRAQAAAAEDAATKATVVDEPQEPKASSRVDEILANMKRMAEDLAGELKVPSGQRVLLTLAASFLTGGLIGYIGAELLGYLVVGAAVLTGSAFLSMLVMVLGFVLVFYAAYVAGGYVGEYVMSCKVDRHYEIVKSKAVSLKNWVTGLLGSSEDEPVVA